MAHTVHPTQKPVELCEYLIKTYTSPGLLRPGHGADCTGAGGSGRWRERLIIPLPCVVNFAVEFYSRLGYTNDRKELNLMPNIKPISDLRNYSEVLHDVAVGAPVFLTKNGRGRYAIIDIQDYEKTQATIRLMNELEKGRKSGEEKGWLTLEAVEENLGLSHE